MADILKLSQARKARDKAAEKARAAENRVKFGRTKAEKAADRQQSARAVQTLDQHRRADLPPDGSVPDT